MIKNFIILALITVNGVFGWTLFQRTSDIEQAKPTAPVNAPSAVVASSNREILEPESSTSAQTTIPSSTSYQDLIEELRSAGYDEALTRQMVLATINRDHQQALVDEIQAPYWQPLDQDAAENLNREITWEASRRQQLLQLFGDEIIDDPLFSSIFKPLNSSLPFLSSDKQIKLDELQRRDEVNTQNIFSGGFTQEGREDLQQQRQNLQRQIEELLGTEDAFEYHLRESTLADRLRRGLNSFDYSEREFREIFALRKAQEGVEFTRFNNRAEYREQRQESEARIRDYLGPTRYEEYARSQDPAYRSLQSIGERYGNTTSEINEVYTVTHEAQQEIDEIRSDNTHSRSERRELIFEIQNNSHQKIERIAGEETANSIRDNSRRMGFGRRITPRS